MRPMMSHAHDVTCTVQQGPELERVTTGREPQAKSNDLQPFDFTIHDSLFEAEITFLFLYQLPAPLVMKKNKPIFCRKDSQGDLPPLGSRPKRVAVTAASHDQMDKAAPSVSFPIRDGFQSGFNNPPIHTREKLCEGFSFTWTEPLNRAVPPQCTRASRDPAGQMENRAARRLNKPTLDCRCLVYHQLAWCLLAAVPGPRV